MIRAATTALDVGAGVVVGAAVGRGVLVGVGVGADVGRGDAVALGALVGAGAGLFVGTGVAGGGVGAGAGTAEARAGALAGGSVGADAAGAGDSTDEPALGVPVAAEGADVDALGEQPARAHATAIAATTATRGCRIGFQGSFMRRGTHHATDRISGLGPCRLAMDCAGSAARVTGQEVGAGGTRRPRRQHVRLPAGEHILASVVVPGWMSERRLRRVDPTPPVRRAVRPPRRLSVGAYLKPTLSLFLYALDP